MTDVFAAVKKKNKQQVDFVGHFSLPAVQIILIARKAINQEPSCWRVTRRRLIHCLARHTSWLNSLSLPGVIAWYDIHHGLKLSVYLESFQVRP